MTLSASYTVNGEELADKADTQDFLNKDTAPSGGHVQDEFVLHVEEELQQRAPAHLGGMHRVGSARACLFMLRILSVLVPSSLVCLINAS